MALPAGTAPTEAVRLSLIQAEPGGVRSPAALAGAWWPRSRELAREVPLLVSALAEHGIRVTRLVYHPALWLIAPSKLRLDGGVVHLGWDREIDPNLVSLRTGDGASVDLLAIPPEATEIVAAGSMAAATDLGNQLSPSNILDASGGVPALDRR